MFDIKRSSSQFVSFPAGSTCKRRGNTAAVGKLQLFQCLFSTRGNTGSKFIVLCSYPKLFQRFPLKEWLLKCKPKRSIPSARRSYTGYTVLPSPQGYRPMLPSFPQQKEVAPTMTFHQHLFFLHYCWS